MLRNLKCGCTMIRAGSPLSSSVSSWAHMTLSCEKVVRESDGGSTQVVGGDQWWPSGNFTYSFHHIVIIIIIIPIIMYIVQIHLTYLFHTLPFLEQSFRNIHSMFTVWALNDHNMKFFLSTYGTRNVFLSAPTRALFVTAIARSTNQVF